MALHAVSAKCYAALEMRQESKKAAARVLRVNAGFTLRAFGSYVPFTDKRDLQRNIEMLCKAGCRSDPQKRKISRDDSNG